MDISLSKQHPKPKSKTHNYPTQFLISIIFQNAANFVGNINGIIFTSFVLYLGIPDAKIAIILSLFGFCQLLQILSTLIYHHYPNKKQVIYLFRISRSFIMIAIAFIPILLPSQYYFIALLALLFTRMALINLLGGAFIEWNDYYVPESKKGKYYGTRNVLFNLTSIILSFGFGLLLDTFSGNNNFYILAFSSSVLFTIISLWTVKNIPFPNQRKSETTSILKEYLVPLKDRTYIKFIGFSLLWAFSCGIGRPMINVYAIKHLNYSYSTLAFAASLAAGFKLVSGMYFGHVIDKKGGNYVVTLCGIGFAIFNILYIFMVPNNPLIFIVINVINGMFMIGFNVSKFRQNVKLAKGVHMNTYLSIHSFFMGLGTFISINISGLIIGLLEDSHITLASIHLNSYQILLMLSGILNLIAVYYFVRNFSIRETANG